MKKVILFLSLLLFIFSNVDADAPDPVSNKVALTVNDVDRIEFSVIQSDAAGNIGTEISDNIVKLAKDSEYFYYVSHFFFRLKITSSHKVQISLTSSGPLTYDAESGKTADTIDYLMYYGFTTTGEDGTGSLDSDLVDLSPGLVFGTAGSAAADYTEKKYFHIGRNGYLNLNDVTMGYFYVMVQKDAVKGKTAETYRADITVVATNIE